MEFPFGHHHHHHHRDDDDDERNRLRPQFPPPPDVLNSFNPLQASTTSPINRLGIRPSATVLRTPATAILRNPTAPPPRPSHYADDPSQDGRYEKPYGREEGHHRPGYSDDVRHQGDGEYFKGSRRTKVKDEEGFPAFALVNKATGQAIKHSVGATHPVQLVPYKPNFLDESVLWTESRDLGDGFRCIRMVNNISLNFDAFNGDEDHGGVHEGTVIVLWEWLKGKNQRVEVVVVVKDPEEDMDHTDDIQYGDMHDLSANIRVNNDIIVDGLCDGFFATQVNSENFSWYQRLAKPYGFISLSASSGLVGERAREEDEEKLGVEVDMESLPAYFQQDPPLLSLSQIPQQQLPPQPQPPPTMSDTKEAPEGTVATLLVRHLPEGIPDDMLSRLFSHCGAASVRPCAGGSLRNCAFMDFKDEALASQAHLQLNRLRFLGKVLTVDRADKATSKNINPKSVGLSLKDASAPRLGVDYPFPPHLDLIWCHDKLLIFAQDYNVLLWYAYPPPDGNILTNIVNALIAVPHFYTQVLHLMNKMNLPAPFRMALPTPPLPPPVPAPPPPPPPFTPKPQSVDLSSSESELESSEEDADDGHAHKRAKRETIVGPAVDKCVEHLSIKITAKPAQKDIAEDDVRISEPTETSNAGKSYLTQEEISRGKMPPEEILSLPMFKAWKNYATGNPATVLYIKNLAKDVVVDDFYFIFGSLFESVEATKSNLNIKLMQEGRMRGQAFVTFPTIDLAHRALLDMDGRPVSEQNELQAVFVLVLIKL
ncbi:hypothetical protein IEQ34_000147 [Dendrobium chrysotoxum]|uniref:RRM domain-containing protein n=1 Tax=Dendrobium chrysotoxum TaxID=161865 RepID=A0AAV7HQ88_DENCH|nr:hypothetical protein IEQ34_000147 [Dendrobium chrysotoxum]